MRTLAVAHSCILSLALLTHFTLSPYVDVTFASRTEPNGIDGPICVVTSTCQFKSPGLAERHSDAEYFLLNVLGRPESRPPMFQTPSGGVCKCVSAILPISNQSFYCGFHPSSFVLDREHSRYRKFLQVQQNKFVLAEVALRFWCRFDTFLDVVCFPRSTPINPTFGLWNRP